MAVCGNKMHRFIRCHIRLALQIGSKMHRFGLAKTVHFGINFGGFQQYPQTTRARQQVTPHTHLPRHPPTDAPTQTPAHHQRTHRGDRPFRWYTHDCDSGAPPAARIPATKARFFQKKILGKNL